MCSYYIIFILCAQNASRRVWLHLVCKQQSFGCEVTFVIFWIYIGFDTFKTWNNQKKRFYYVLIIFLSSTSTTKVSAKKQVVAVKALVHIGKAEAFSSCCCFISCLSTSYDLLKRHWCCMEDRCLVEVLHVDFMAFSLVKVRILSGVGGCVGVGVCSFWHKAVFFPPEAQKYTSMKILQPYTLV